MVAGKPYQSLVPFHYQKATNMTETELAQRLHRDLGALATDALWSSDATSGQAEGNYTDPIADAKEDAGIDDLADATAAQLKAIRRGALGYCFDRLLAHYAQAIDTSSDGQNTSYSQISTNIQAARVAILGRTAKGVNLRGYPKRDYTAEFGNAATPATE